MEKKGNVTNKKKFGNKRNFNSRNKDDAKITENKSKINDPEWYVKEPQLAKDVASFSFNNALGATYSLAVDSPGTTFSGTDYDVGSVIPGIMSIYTGPAVNPSSNAYSALNLATKDLFKRVRKMNAGSTNYDPSDLMLYILALDSIYSGIFFLQRIYGCATVYSQINRYVGDAYIAAQGVIPSSVRHNLADFRADINMLITKVSAFATPKDIALFKRHAWMYTGMYMDEPVKKAQVYMYNPAYIWKYNETSGAPGKLEPQYLTCYYDTSGTAALIKPRTSSVTTDPNALLNFGSMLRLVEDCVQAVVESQDMNIMSGDILKAYGDEGIWRMSLIDENFATIPTFSDEVLDQIHNTIFTGVYPSAVLDPTTGPVYSDARLGVTQTVSATGNYLNYEPQFLDATHLSFKHLLDMCDDNPTPERVLVATRNMTHGISVALTGFNSFATDLYACGSDIALMGAVWRYNSGVLSVATYGKSAQDYPATDTYGRFHKAPIFYRMATNGTQMQNIYGEVGNFTIVDSSDLLKLHESAMLSLLGVSI